jgi:uroporphyrinogen-III synthase
MSLEGRTVLVTRRKEQAGELCLGLQRLGARVVVFPLISITGPDSWTDCDAAIARLEEFVGIFFTSANAVEMFVNRVRSRPAAFPSLARSSLYAVGARTRDALAGYGLSVQSIPSSFSGRDLGSVIARGDVRGKEFLHPRGNLGRGDAADAIRRAGGLVREVEVYRTSDPDPAGWAEIRRLIEAGEIDAIAFASPSAVRAYVGLFPPEEFSRLPKRPGVAVIGSATADAAMERALPVDAVADESSSGGLIRAIETILSSEHGE